MFHTGNNWQVALVFYLGSIENHYPKDPFNTFFEIPYAYCLKLHKNPIEITFDAFTDGSSKEQGKRFI